VTHDALPNWIEYLKIFGPIIVGLLSVILAFTMNIITLNNKKREDKIESIKKKIDEFYSPFDQYRKKSLKLYKIFKKNREESFRTLPALLWGKDLDNNDQQLIEEIISIDQKLETMIFEKSGFVDDEDFRELLAKASTHFYIIREAYHGRLKEETDRFMNYVFPHELDKQVSKQITKLKNELERLQ